MRIEDSRSDGQRNPVPWPVRPAAGHPYAQQWLLGAPRSYGGQRADRRARAGDDAGWCLVPRIRRHLRRRHGWIEDDARPPFDGVRRQWADRAQLGFEPLIAEAQFFIEPVPFRYHHGPVATVATHASERPRVAVFPALEPLFANRTNERSFYHVTSLPISALTRRYREATHPYFTQF